jgi:hypothetical protein
MSDRNQLRSEPTCPSKLSYPYYLTITCQSIDSCTIDDAIPTFSPKGLLGRAIVVYVCLLAQRGSGEMQRDRPRRQPRSTGHRSREIETQSFPLQVNLSQSDEKSVAER